MARPVRAGVSRVPIGGAGEQAGERANGSRDFKSVIADAADAIGSAHAGSRPRGAEGPAQAFKDGGGAECGTAIVRRPDSSSPAAPVQERRGRRGWPRWVRAPRGDGQGGPARAPTPPLHRPRRQRARRAPAARPERPPGAEPGGASPRAPTSRRWKPPPCPAGIAVRRFPRARPERPLLRAAVVLCFIRVFSLVVLGGGGCLVFLIASHPQAPPCSPRCGLVLRMVEGKEAPCVYSRPLLARGCWGCRSRSSVCVWAKGARRVPVPCVQGTRAWLGSAAKLGGKGTNECAGASTVKVM